MHTSHLPTSPAFRFCVRAIAGIALCGLSMSTCAAASAATADTTMARVGVIGNIVPGACRLAFADNGSVDYGDIPLSSIPLDKPLHLEAKRINFTITCDDMVRLSMKARDEKAGTAVLGLNPGEDANAFGLGRVEGINIGQFSVRAVPRTFTGLGPYGDLPTFLLISKDNGASWEISRPEKFAADGSVTHSFCERGLSKPSPYSRLVGELEVKASINQRSQLPKGRIPLAGVASIELTYE